MRTTKHETAALLELLAAQAEADWQDTLKDHPEYDSQKHRRRFFHSWLVECWGDFWSGGEKPERRAAFVRVVSWQRSREQDEAGEKGELFPDFDAEFFDELEDDCDSIAL